MGLVASHVSPVARSMRRVRTTRRARAVRVLASGALLIAVLAVALIFAGAAAHDAWHLLAFGWRFVG
jgi:hypothetical protein